MRPPSVSRIDSDGFLSAWLGQSAMKPWLVVFVRARPRFKSSAILRALRVLVISGVLSFRWLRNIVSGDLLKNGLVVDQSLVFGCVHDILGCLDDAFRSEEPTSELQ